MRIKLFGIKIKVEFSFLLVIAFSVLISNYDFCKILLFSMLHELGHIVALYSLGCVVNEIVISYYGIGIKYSNDISNMIAIVILICGPLINLLFVLTDVEKNVNLALFIINILPLYPLDGGRILKILLNSCFSLAVSDFVFKIVTILFLIALLMLCFYIKNGSLFMIFVYIVFYGLNNSFD